MQKSIKPQPHKEDLEWLFGESESEMGVHSNFSAIIMASKFGSKRTLSLVDGVREVADPFAENPEDAIIDVIDRKPLGRLVATTKNRRVMRAYAGLLSKHKVVLEAAYEPKQVPPEVRRVFNGHSTMVHLTAIAQSIPSFTLTWLEGAVLRRDPRVPEMMKEAHKLLSSALAAYRKEASK